jgi:hypothetical protein
MWPFKKRKIYVKMGGEQIEIKPLPLQSVVELTLLMAPYWPLLDDYLPQIKMALAAKDKSLLSEILFILRGKMQEIPGDIVKVVALLAGVEATWLDRQGTGEEIVNALPVLDKAHDLGKLWHIMRKGSVYLSPSDQ